MYARAPAAKRSDSFSRTSAFVCSASRYWGITNGVSGALRFFRGFVATQASTAGLNSFLNRSK